MPLPHQLRDRPTHRVADGDAPLDAQDVHDCHGIVGAVLQTEQLARADATPVAPVVEGDHAELPAQWVVAREPVEVGGGRPAVQQQQRGRTWRPGHRAHEGGAPARQLHRRALRQLRCVDAASVTDGHYGDSTSSTLTRMVPWGA
jgi:hypothetical protein